MADIHIYKAGSEPRVCPEEGIADLLKTGELSPEMFYWREGMAQWEPLATFQVKPAPPPESIVPPRRTGPLPEVSPGLAPQPETAPGPVVENDASGRRTGRERFRFRKSPEPLTTIVQVLLIICICVAALELANAVVRYATLSGTPDRTDQYQPAAPAGDDSLLAGPNVTPPVPDETDDTGSLLEWTGWVVNGLLIVPYFMWLYRTNQNCRHFSFIMRFKPQWAVGCHFVPPMNVFRPCQVLQEIWRVSNNPRTWHNDRRSVLVGIWWALTLATIGLSVYNCVQSLEAATSDDHAQVALVFIVLKVIQLAWYGTFLAMVSMIIQKQILIVKKSRRKAEAEDAA
jgi:hypothetical protein